MEVLRLKSIKISVNFNIDIYFFKITEKNIFYNKFIVYSINLWSILLNFIFIFLLNNENDCLTKIFAFFQLFIHYYLFIN